MQAFEFRLDSVLRFRERSKKLAEVQRQLARQALNAAEMALAQLQRRLQAVAAEILQSILGRSEGIAHWRALYDQSQWLAGRLTAAEQAVRAAHEAAARADALYRQAATRVEALVDLKAQRWQAYRGDAARLEQQRLEELVLRRWNEAMIAAPDDLNPKEMP